MGRVYPRAMVLQQKAQIPVQFEITKTTRDSIQDYLSSLNSNQHDFLFKSRFSSSDHLSTRQYARIVKKWVISIGLNPSVYATH